MLDYHETQSLLPFYSKKTRKENWSSWDELPSLQKNVGVREVYRRLAYDLDAAASAKAAAGELGQHLQARILDTGLFHAALNRALSVYRAYESAADKKSAPFISGYDYDNLKPLAHADEARDETGLLQHLTRLGMKGDLPWELRDGSIVMWRPVDAPDFDDFLGDLSAKVNRRWTLPPENVRAEILDAVANLRSAVATTNSCILNAAARLADKLAFVYIALDWDYGLQTRKGELEDLLCDLVHDHYESSPEQANFKEDAQGRAKKYLDSQWMHTASLTNTVIQDLLDADIGPAAQVAKPGFDPSRMTSALEYPWNVLVANLLSLAFLAFMLLAAYWAVIKGYPWLAVIIGAYLIWHYVARFRRHRAVRKAKGEVVPSLSVLVHLRDEISSGDYDADEMQRRFRLLEGKQVFVHSLVYPLLRLQSASSRAA